MVSKALDPIIHELEQLLRISIKKELSSFSPNWWNSLIPFKLRQQAESRKRNEEHEFSSIEKDVFAYLEFSDYIKIITYKQNWNLIFEPIFKDKDTLTKTFKILTYIRNTVSHGRKLNNIYVQQLPFLDQAIRAAIENSNTNHYVKNISILTKNDILKKLNNLNFEEFAIHKLQLRAASDRSVYPVDAYVHIRAIMQHVLAGEPITFQIFNAQQELCAEKYLDPLTYDNGKPKFGGQYQITFDPSEFKSHVGDVIYAKVKHGKAIATDQWLVDQQKPIIRTDKPIHVVNSDIIVTVIDPDANKNSQQVEFVGDRKDSKLIIESEYGKIDGYRLQETGVSTGIFQGVLGILGIRKDGTVIKQEFGDKIIDKIQGTGLEDGFIGARPGEEIKFSYKSKSGKTSIVTYMSDFGVTIELDQAVYAPNDIVYITIVAPDLNFNPSTIDEIGNDLETKICIRTRNDKIINYRLLETGHDTGIFAGQIQLGSDFEKSSDMLGPNNGKINCKSKDFIEVSLEYLDGVYSSRATVCPLMGV